MAKLILSFMMKQEKEMDGRREKRKFNEKFMMKGTFVLPLTSKCWSYFS